MTRGQTRLCYKGPVSDRDAEIRLAADRALLDLARKGDVVAFEKLVAQYTSRVYNLALRMTSSAQDAQEITQDTFLSAYQNLGNFRGESAFGSWVFNRHY